MIRRRAVLGGGFAAAAWSLIGCSDDSATEVASPEPTLDALVDAVNGGIQVLSTRLIDLSTLAASDGLDSAGVTKALVDLRTADPSIVAAASIDADGIVKASAGDAFVVGMPVVEDPDTLGAHNGGKQHMSSLINHGATADVLLRVQPVLDGDGARIGAISVLIQPHIFFESSFANASVAVNGTVVVGQPDGRLLLDPDPEDLYEQVFESEAFTKFPELQELAKKISEADSGNTTYAYRDAEANKDVSWNMHWATAAALGAKWRVILQVA